MKIDFEKGGGLVPAIIQDAETKNVLMLGYMNQESLDKTMATGKVTFWSRSRNELWTKGETSGNGESYSSIKTTTCLPVWAYARIINPIRRWLGNTSDCSSLPHIAS